jgi:hypothetical protein
MTSKALHSATSSRESAGGRMPSDSLAGPTLAPSGPVPAPASLSARQAKGWGLLTSGIYGPPGSGSFSSVALASSLASRLTKRLHGSTLWRLTWKGKTTPAGRSFSLLRASAHRTAGIACGSWPTPTVEQTTHSYGPGKTIQLRLTGAARLADPNDDWPAHSVGVATWPTPRAEERQQENSRDGYVALSKAVKLASWRSPAAQNADRGGQNAEARIAGGHTLNLQDQVTLASGPTPTGSTAATESIGQLNHIPVGSWGIQPRGTPARLRQRDRPARSR